MRSAAWWWVSDGKTVLHRVEERLIEGGAVIELDQFNRLSADEVDTLLWLERNWPVWS